VKKEKTKKKKKRYRRAEEVDVDEDVFAVVEVQFSGFEHYLAHSVSRRTQHHNCTYTSHAYSI